MTETEKIAFNLRLEVEAYGKDKYDEGWEDGLREGESRTQKDEYQKGFDAGVEQGEEDADPSEKQMIEYMLDKLEEAETRSLSRDQIIAELQSELCRHMPVIGPTLFDK